MLDCYYRIADLPLRLSFAEGNIKDQRLISSMEPFAIERTEEELLFSLCIDDELKPVPQEERKRIRVVDTGNGETVVDQTTDGGYQFVVRNIFGRSCCLLIVSSDFKECRCALAGDEGMRTFGLSNAIMLVYAFAGIAKDAILIHASLVREAGYGYAFTAKSGTGKSTQVANWLRYIPECDLMNDDNPVIRLIDGEAWVYGSPWSGKTPCYRNIKARLGAVTQITRAPENSVERMEPIEAFAMLLPACSTMKWDTRIFSEICRVVSKLIETTPIYNLNCTKEKESAIVCQREISKSRK